MNLIIDRILILLHTKYYLLIHENFRAMPTDIYLILVIATVSLVVIGVIMYALYKAIKILKMSIRDAQRDSLPSSSNNQRRREGQNRVQRGGLGISNSEARNSASNSSLPRSASSNGVTPTGTARRGAGIAALPFFQGTSYKILK